MMMSYEFDPAIHQIVDLPVANFLKRELKRDDLVTYYHKVFKNWVVALKSDNRLLDLGLIGDGETGGQNPPKEAVDKIISRLNDLIDAVEARKRLRRNQSREIKVLAEDQEKLKEAQKIIYDKVKRLHGYIQADRYKAMIPSCET